MTKLDTHSNRGKVAEAMVRSACAAYQGKGRAMIRQIEAPARGPQGQAWRTRSTVDFLGTVGLAHPGGVPVAFDVKSTEKGRWDPIAQLEPHQAFDLDDYERAGGASFILLFFMGKFEHECYLLPWPVVLDLLIDRLIGEGRGVFTRREMGLPDFQKYRVTMGEGLVADFLKTFRELYLRPDQAPGWDVSGLPTGQEARRFCWRTWASVIRWQNEFEAKIQRKRAAARARTVGRGDVR